MKKKIYNITLLILRKIVDPLLLKNRNKVVLYSSTGVLDANLECVKAYLYFYYPNIKVVVLKGKIKNNSQKIICFLYTFFTSYYVIVDHAIPRFITNNKREIYNVWHGIPLKTIRHFDQKRFTGGFLDFESQNLTGLVCSSPLDKGVMAACFNVPTSKCILSGLPRADLLESNGLEWFTDHQEQELIKDLNGRKLISWMPTYRGTWEELNEITAFSYEEEVLMSEFLKRNNAVLGVRPHKFSKLQPLLLLEENNLLVNLEKYMITNTLLKHTQVLITDYSSVWLDYSLISKNICLYLFDAQEYDDERGMIYPLEEVVTGEISYDFTQLLFSLNKMIEIDSTQKIQPSKLFFKYNDACNTKRFVEHMLNKNT
ncbi:CDP-glycerol glycerophosphotransferase family protein [Psychromonas sp. SP041]|uniref:CDP-glycerol glycerophosphotransferase family protein n=1 Tax=Psychromonas sp. SP041 TaxID=1365007 RepID=UPI000427B3C2|nr:CDP-glycerol glycerophosphotransferase family protein [Psychromonas sp. SP041]